MRSALLILVTAFMLAACAARAPVACEVIERDPPPPLSCEAAVTAARGQLAAVVGVSELSFQYDECAPDADRCAFLFGTAGNVIATSSDGREIAVFVSIDGDGVVRAGGPRPFSGEVRPTPLP